MLAFASLCWGLGGCASFNDSVTVDIGDQFDLLAVDVAAGAGGSRQLHEVRASNAYSTPGLSASHGLAGSAT